MFCGTVSVLIPITQTQNTHTGKTMAEKYRYDNAYGKLYEWDEEQHAYVYVCRNPFNLSKQDLIAEYEAELSLEEIGGVFSRK